MAFPSPPYTNGQTYSENGITYSYNTTAGAWLKAAPAVTITGDVPTTRTVTGITSVSGGGALNQDLTFQLLNDIANPGTLQYYGTNSAGVKGWHTIFAVQRSLTLTTTNSLTGGGDLMTNRTFTLVNDSANPGVDRYYGTNATGIKGWQPFAPYVLETRRIDTDMSLTGGGDLSANRTLTLVNDVASPGSRKVYGTDSSGVRGWFDAPPVLQQYGGFFQQQAVAVGGFVQSNSGSGTGITVTNDATNGASFALTANRKYNIIVSLYGSNAVTSGTTLSLVNRTDNTNIVAAFFGNYNGFYTPTANVNIGVKIASGNALTAAQGSIAIYTID